MNPIAAILLMAVITYFIRSIPLIFIKEHINNVFIQSFLHYIPFGILTAMTIPYIFYATGHLLSALAGTATALLLAWMKKSLITVSMVSVAIAYVVETLLAIQHL